MFHGLGATFRFLVPPLPSYPQPRSPLSPPNEYLRRYSKGANCACAPGVLVADRLCRRTNGKSTSGQRSDNHSSRTNTSTPPHQQLAPSRHGFHVHSQETIRGVCPQWREQVTSNRATCATYGDGNEADTGTKPMLTTETCNLTVRLHAIGSNQDKAMTMSLMYI